MAKMKINNFENLDNLLVFNSSDDFYYIMVVRRGKDNNFDEEPYEEILPDTIEKARHIKEYVITSYQDVLNNRDEIISLCEANNARAYITINSRSFERTNRELDFRVAAIISRFVNDEKYAWETLNPRTLIDIDIDDPNGLAEADRIIRENLPDKPVMSSHSPYGGVQYVMPKRDVQAADFSGLDVYPRVGREICDPTDERVKPAAFIVPDGMIILYANLK